MNNKILFISRRYPPVVGGMEEYMFQLVSEAKKHLSVCKIVLRKSQVNLLWFIPWSFFYGLFLVYTKKISHVHIGDGVMTGVGVLLKWFTSAKVSATVHGLDVTYKKKIYQFFIKFTLPKIPKVVCVSSATLEQCKKRGVALGALNAIPNGINPDLLLYKQGKAKSRMMLAEELTMDLNNKKVIVTVGRLIKRKGVLNFIKNIFPLLPENYLYFIAGSGPEESAIKSIISELNLAKRVFLLGKISEELKLLLYEGSNCFVMPNIRVSGDMEGFGIVIVEAGIFGTPVVAFAVDGIVDAVIEGKTGFLIKENDNAIFVKKIMESEKFSSDEISDTVKINYSWTGIFKKYMEFLEI